MALCKHVGDLSIECDDGHVIQSKWFYNPHASDTIISPQAILDQLDQFTKWIHVGWKIGQPGLLVFQGPGTSWQITLHQTHGLYYCKAIKHDIYQAQQGDNDWIYANTQVNHATSLTTGVPPSRRTQKGVLKTAKYQPTSKAKILESET